MPATSARAAAYRFSELPALHESQRTVAPHHPAQTPSPLPPLDAMTLHSDDLPDFTLLFSDAEAHTNEAIAARSEDPRRRRRRLEEWGRLDGFAVRYVPGNCRSGFAVPIVVDSSVARFTRGAGALQALADDLAYADLPNAQRLFPRNIADNTECVHLLFEEDGVRFTLYRVDFRVQNIVGSVGVVWRWPHGGPIQALKLAERQVSRIRTALRFESAVAARSGSGRVERKERQLSVIGEA